MINRTIRLAAIALLLCGGLTSCNLLTAPLKLLGRAANGILAPVGGLGGAAGLAPLLLDAKDGSNKPVRGMEVKLMDKAPSQRVEQEQQVVMAQRRLRTTTMSE